MLEECRQDLFVAVYKISIIIIDRGMNVIDLHNSTRIVAHHAA